MKKFLALGLLVVFVSACVGTEAGAEDANLRSVSVTGSGEIEATPDAAWVSMGIEARHRKLKTAQAEVDTKVASFLKLVDQLDIDRKYVKTTGKNVRPEYRWDDKTNKRYLTGYFVSRQLQVDLRDLDKLGELLHQAVESGVNQVSPPQMRATNQQELHRQALAKAAADAKANAAVLAQSLDAKLGDVRNISAQHRMHQPQPRYRMEMAASVKSMDAAPQTYETGQIRITTTVNATFDLR